MSMSVNYLSYYHLLMVVRTLLFMLRTSIMNIVVFHYVFADNRSVNPSCLRFIYLSKHDCGEIHNVSTISHSKL